MICIETLESKYFVIKYHQGYVDDARKTLDIAIEVREITLEKYLHELSSKVIIYVYLNRVEIQKEKRVPTALSEVDPSNSQNIIHILRPSWDSHWSGYEQLDNPFRRVLNHEYVHVVFYNNLYLKKRGYKDSPSWFSQGIAEYISQNYLPSYEKKVRESVQRGSFMISEPYSWGLYIVEFMFARYCKEKVINLIQSDALTFIDALKKEMGVSSSEFEEGWRAYLAERFE